MGRYLIFLCLSLSVSVASSETRGRKPDKDDGKIVGGKVIDISEAPYQCSLGVLGSHICGASLITTSFVLTAAHCVEEANLRSLTLRLGSNSHARGGEFRLVRNLVIHPSYSTTTSERALVSNESNSSTETSGKINAWNKNKGKFFNSDIAILEMHQPVELGQNIQTIALPAPKSEPAPKARLRVTGWGATKEGGGPSRKLREVTVPVFRRTSCQRAYASYNNITRYMFCGGYQKGGKDSCQGDSGGPAVIGKELVGVVSWGVGCARKNMPGVYTRVSQFRPWIRSIAGV